MFARIFLFSLIVIICLPFMSLEAKITDSGGLLLPEQAAYDVKFYEINLKIDPQNKFISGYTAVEVLVLETLNVFVLHLNANFIVDSVKWYENGSQNIALNYNHQSGLLRIDLPQSQAPGENVKVRIFYNGQPKESNNPPWDTGFVWKKTQNSLDWVGVACEDEGGDLWWPCKDHPSDEPDSVALHFTVPQHLTCVANGKLLNITDNKNGTKTFFWFVSNPINNYNVTLYIAPYQTITHQYESVTGETFPVTIWVLPESFNTAVGFTTQFLDHLRFIEETCGPYPFWNDKYGVAEAPYLGMEHQTIIAYGNGYQNNSYGFDWLHLHELAHEWWGNLVTAEDWSDVWIHEGTATYIEALYAEKLGGKEAYKSYMNSKSRSSNLRPIAPREILTASQGFATSDVYRKAAWVLHTLRYYLGDDSFFNLFRRWAYPEPALELVRDGSQCRLATTDDFLQLGEEITGTELDWFFEVYLRQASLPTLIVAFKDSTLNLTWEVENNIPFNLPVEIETGDSIFRVEMPFGRGEVKLADGMSPKIDPNNWILKKVEDSFENSSFDRGILLVNGVSFSGYGAEIIDAYQKNAFWGDYPISFWDCFDPPSGGYPANLPTPSGHGRVPGDFLGQFSTLIWVGNNAQGDLAPWQDTSILAYLQAGGNVLLMTRSGRSFITPELMQYLGIYWEEEYFNTISNCLAEYPGLISIPLTGNQSANAVFDTTLANSESRLLFKETSSFALPRGLGVWRKPAAGGEFRSDGGQFVFISGRPYRYDPDVLSSNVEFILENFFHEIKTGVKPNSDNISIKKYQLEQNYPNPFNSTTIIQY